jgi:hypothetical protein
LPIRRKKLGKKKMQLKNLNLQPFLICFGKEYKQFDFNLLFCRLLKWFQGFVETKVAQMCWPHHYVFVRHYSVANPHHFVVAPAMGNNFYVAPAALSATGPAP